MRAAIIIFCLFSCFCQPVGAVAGDPVKIGVLAFRSPDKTLEQWRPTAKALSRLTGGIPFRIIPMNYPEVNAAVEERTIDFVLTNTGHYVELESTFGIARIATLVKSVNGKAVKAFGGVIFTRSDRKDIRTIGDLKGKSVLAVKKSSLGGFLVAWEQFEGRGIDPFTDFSPLTFNGMPHDEVVLKVLAGEFDAGTVRTGILEQMAAEQKINPDDITLLNPRSVKGFPYALSTGLYPEWPFSRLSHTGDDLVEKVTVALLNIKPDSPAATAGRYDRWIPPLDYSAVHAMFRTLKIGPYKDFGAFTLGDVFQKYLTEIISILIVFALGGIAMVRIIRLNRSLKKAYAEVKTLSGLVPICSSCKNIRDDKGYWNRIETYIQAHSEARFSHGMCPDCEEKLYGNEDWYQKIKEKNR
ncbi:MAG: phosphate/phosphite/phosphonate ABC transporter substrate-binding protein [Desulfobacterales bacterium]|nr:phosphate/phosphite/phosphonate ABC transporter substrate-binding protein [Desulfobacterales bacterium]